MRQGIFLSHFLSTSKNNITYLWTVLWFLAYLQSQSYQIYWEQLVLHRLVKAQHFPEFPHSLFFKGGCWSTSPVSRWWKWLKTALTVASVSSHRGRPWWGFSYSKYIEALASAVETFGEWCLGKKGEWTPSPEVCSYFFVEGANPLWPSPRFFWSGA